MFQLIALSNPHLARSFVHYMQQQNIKIILVEEQGMYELWLYDEVQLEYTRQCLKDFLTNPYHENYQSNHDDFSKNTFHSNYSNWWQLCFSLLRPVGSFTLFIAVVSIFIYILSVLFGSTWVFQWLHYPLAGQQWQLWRYITPIFMHFSVAHILFNLMWWWYLGDRVERYQGKKFLGLFLLLTAIIPNYFQTLVHGIHFGGLSGVIYGLLGYTWVMGIKHPQKGIYLEKGLFALAIIWLLLGFTRIFGPQANTVHGVGFIIGLLLGYWDIRRGIGRSM